MTNPGLVSSTTYGAQNIPGVIHKSRDRSKHTEGGHKTKTKTKHWEEYGNLLHAKKLFGNICDHYQRKL